MCRLVLLNAQTVRQLEDQFESAPSALSCFFWELEQSTGGHGNGVAALWTGPPPTTRVRKGRRFTARQATAQLSTWQAQGAEWFLFHTRRATAAPIATRHGHPFQAGKLVLAHNGHDPLWAVLGRASALLRMTESEAITRPWAAMPLPPSALLEARGVFAGFHAGRPLVVKGSASSELVAAQAPGGAVLFASELPDWLEAVFQEVVEGGTCVWTGGALDLDQVRR